MSIAHGRHSATLLDDGRVLVTGGYSGSNPIGVAELYNPATGSWSTTGHLNAARQGHTATLLQNGKVLVSAGYGWLGSSWGVLSSAELYDPATGMWATTASMHDAREKHIAVLLGNGKVLVAGGYDSDHDIWLASAELYTAPPLPVAVFLPLIAK
jgi:hypothetical protein